MKTVCAQAQLVHEQWWLILLQPDNLCMRKAYILLTGRGSNKLGRVPYQLPEDGQLCLSISVNKWFYQLVKNTRQDGHSASESLRSILHVAFV